MNKNQKIACYACIYAILAKNTVANRQVNSTFHPQFRASSRTPAIFSNCIRNARRAKIKMGIFHQDCPQCSATSAPDIMYCQCGYCFAPEKITDEKEAAEYLEQQEARLYRDYLEARAVQAEAGLEAAREELSYDPFNTHKAAQVLLAEQAHNTARAELKIHNKILQEYKNREASPPRPKISQISAEVKEPPKPLAKTQTPKLISEPVSAPPSQSSNIVSLRTEISVNFEPRKTAYTFSATPTPASPKQSTSTSKPSQSVPQQPETSTSAKSNNKGSRAIQTLQEKKSGYTFSATPTSVTSKQSTSSSRPSQPKSQRSKTPVTSEPIKEFREPQADKVKKIAYTFSATPVSAAPVPKQSAQPSKPSYPVPQRSNAETSAEPSQEFRAAQADKAERAVHTFSATPTPVAPLPRPQAQANTPKSAISSVATELQPDASLQCPNCTATVSADMTRCRCGFSFNLAFEMPPLLLDSSTLTLLSPNVDVGRGKRN